MPNLEKTLKGLECLITNEVPCEGCPYMGSGYCLLNIAKDAKELLKEQEEKYNKLAEWSEGHIVFCKDCKHHRECDYWIENGNDWFCADGEREDAENH